MTEPDNVRPMTFRELPAASFPFTVEFIAELTGQVVLAATVTGPGALHIPPLTAEHGDLLVRVTYGDGEVVEEPTPR